MDFRAYNREAWDREVERGDRWTVPFGPDVIEAAREGRWEVLLTEAKPVPQSISSIWSWWTTLDKYG
jgi:hypothetical protein